MIFSENRYTLFRIMLWRQAVLFASPARTVIPGRPKGEPGISRFLTRALAHRRSMLRIAPA
jgi:hypothetical protein